MIDVFHDELVRLNDVPDRLPAGLRPHPCTVIRWATHGIRGEVLDTIVINRVRFTTTDAINDFLRRTSAPKSRIKAGGRPR